MKIFSAACAELGALIVSPAASIIAAVVPVVIFLNIVSPLTVSVCRIRQAQARRPTGQTCQKATEPTLRGLFSRGSEFCHPLLKIPVLQEVCCLFVNNFVGGKEGVGSRHDEMRLHALNPCAFDGYLAIIVSGYDVG